MIEALVAGERDPAVLADVARGVLRKKIGDLTLALAGRFADHHALLCRLHLDHVDHLNAMIDRLDHEIEQAISPFAEQKQRRMSIPGIGERAAQVIIAEIGVDMTRFPTAAHLASWAGLCPGNHESAGKRRTGKTGDGNPHLTTALVEAAWATARTSTRLGARFRRLHRRMGKTAGAKAAIAVAHTLLVITWQPLSHGSTYTTSAPTTTPAATTPRPRRPAHPAARGPRLHRRTQPHRIAGHIRHQRPSPPSTANQPPGEFHLSALRSRPRRRVRRDLIQPGQARGVEWLKKVCPARSSVAFHALSGPRAGGVPPT